MEQSSAPGPDQAMSDRVNNRSLRPRSDDRAKTIGSFDVGKQADITIFDAPNLDYLFYFFATNLVTDVYKKGQKVI